MLSIRPLLLDWVDGKGQNVESAHATNNSHSIRTDSEQGSH